MEVDEDQQHNLLHHVSIQYMKKVIDFYDAIKEKSGKMQHSWKSCQHRFRKVKNRKYIERFLKYLGSAGTKQQKLNEIDQYTFEKERAGFLSVHDIILKKWALEKAREINENTLKASDIRLS